MSCDLIEVLIRIVTLTSPPQPSFPFDSGGCPNDYNQLFHSIQCLLHIVVVQFSEFFYLQDDYFGLQSTIWPTQSLHSCCLSFIQVAVSRPIVIFHVFRIFTFFILCRRVMPIISQRLHFSDFCLVIVVVSSLVSAPYISIGFAVLVFFFSFPNLNIIVPDNSNRTS